MTTFSSSAKPLGFYADGEALNALTEAYGSRLEGMARHEKLILLGAIASKFAYDDGESLDSHYRSAPPLFFVADFVPVSLDEYIPQLDALSEDALLGLCEALYQVAVKDSRLFPQLPSSPAVSDLSPLNATSY